MLSQYPQAMIQNVKNNAKTITLWVGILLALLLIFGTFGFTDASALGFNLDLPDFNDDRLPSIAKITFRNLQGWSSYVLHVILTI